MLIRITLLAVLMVFGVIATAQEEPSGESLPSPSGPARTKESSTSAPGFSVRPTSDEVERGSTKNSNVPSQGPIALSIGVLVFATLLSAMFVYLRLKTGINESTFFRMGGLVLVIGAGLFLIVAGYTEQQIAPMMGLLGTVAGYLLHKGEEGKSQP